MIKVSKLTDYAVVLLSNMADMEQDRVSASGLAQATNLPEPTVCKVLKILTKSNIILSTRGVNGGYSLGADLDSISIAQIICAIDGPIALTACVESGVEGITCCIHNTCTVRGRWDDVNKALHTALDNVKLSDMVQPPLFMDAKEGAKKS